jgi:hypothetical protein
VAGLTNVEDFDIGQFSGTVLVHLPVKKCGVQTVCRFEEGLVCGEDFSNGGRRGDDGVGNALGGQFGQAREELGFQVSNIHKRKSWGETNIKLDLSISQRERLKAALN